MSRRISYALVWRNANEKDKPGHHFGPYAGHASGGRLEAGEECTEVATFPPDSLPELAFPNDGAILDAWRTGRGLDLTIARTVD